MSPSRGLCPVCRRASRGFGWFDAELGIGDGLLRLSVGLEAFEDLAADLDAGLAAVRR